MKHETHYESEHQEATSVDKLLYQCDQLWEKVRSSVVVVFGYQHEHFPIYMLAISNKIHPQSEILDLFFSYQLVPSYGSEP